MNEDYNKKKNLNIERRQTGTQGRQRQPDSMNENKNQDVYDGEKYKTNKGIKIQSKRNKENNNWNL